MSENDKKDDKDQVEVFHRVNRLKTKAGGSATSGDGKLDPEHIEAANRRIAAAEGCYNDELEKILGELNAAWIAIKNSKQADEGEKVRLYHMANQAKDLASTFDCTLMSDFTESLRKFIGVCDFSNDKHRIIVQAHMDVIWIVFRENVRDGGGPLAIELKRQLEAAIKKYT